MQFSDIRLVEQILLILLILVHATFIAPDHPTTSPHGSDHDHHRSLPQTRNTQPRLPPHAPPIKLTMSRKHLASQPSSRNVNLLFKDEKVLVHAATVALSRPVVVHCWPSIASQLDKTAELSR
jgi:hypothetical protein